MSLRVALSFANLRCSIPNVSALAAKADMQASGPNELLQLHES